MREFQSARCKKEDHLSAGDSLSFVRFVIADVRCNVISAILFMIGLIISNCHSCSGLDVESAGTR